LLGLVTLFVACFAGCTAAPLARPAILGASASAGFGCEVTADDGRPYLADMEAVYQAMVRGWHDDPIFLADAGFYSRARQVPVEQMNAALARAPSLIVAVDYLFWPVYSSRPADLSADAIERDRLDALEQALAQLDRFHGPVIVGDIPDMRTASGRMLSLRNIPPPSQLEAFNRRIREWAARRPAAAPAVVIPAFDLGRAIESGAPLPTSFGAAPADDVTVYVQEDRLHPTTTGLIILLREGLAGLAARGIIDADSFRTDLADIAARLPAEARAADSRREPGLWTLLSVKGKLEEFDDAVEQKDCDRAAELFDQVMEKASRLKRSPHEFAGLFVSFTLDQYRRACPDAHEALRRWRDRLDPAIERPVPDPWPFDLWISFNSFINEEHRTTDRARRMKRAGVPDGFAGTLQDAAREARFRDPAAYLELIPSWQTQLDQHERIAREIADYWRTFARSDEWPKYAQSSYDHALKTARSDERRREIEAKRDSYFDVERMVAFARSAPLDDIAALERALRVTGRTDDERVVRARFEALVGPEQAQAVRERVEAQAAAQKPKAAAGS